MRRKTGSVMKNIWHPLVFRVSLQRSCFPKPAFKDTWGGIFVYLFIKKLWIEKYTIWRYEREFFVFMHMSKYTYDKKKQCLHEFHTPKGWISLQQFRSILRRRFTCKHYGTQGSWNQCLQHHLWEYTIKIVS